MATLHLLDHNATLHKEIAITPKDTNPFATQGADLSALSDTFSAIVEGTYSATSEADDLPVLEDVEAASLGEAELAAIGEESPARLENPEKDLSDEECPGSFIYEDSAMRLAAVGNIGLVNSSKVPNTYVPAYPFYISSAWWQACSLMLYSTFNSLILNFLWVIRPRILGCSLLACNERHEFHHLSMAVY